uniref:EF-hand domain-containing protein n=2 Tax=Erythrolobus australicus TaxID=1077150 RepID=A0A7S1TLZ0_9RHOD|mmetsp:Transcript_3560/g.9892  ORF Transcript_3560/g.9892 Transcript_3560/m.9892 type:complete len:663 (+) Transcript_3560:182-2170(+)
MTSRTPRAARLRAREVSRAQRGLRSMAWWLHGLAMCCLMCSVVAVAPPTVSFAKREAKSGSTTVATTASAGAGGGNRSTSRLFKRFDQDGDDLLNEKEVAALLKSLKSTSSLGSPPTIGGMSAVNAGAGFPGGVSTGTRERERGTHDVSLDGETLSVGDSEFELLFRQLSNLKHTRDPSKDPRVSLQEDITFIKDLVVVFLAATIGGALSAQVRFPPLVGFLVGGMVVGPGGLNLVTELVEMETLASVGIALVLFSLGCEFSVSELLSVKRVAIYGGVISMAMIVILCAGLTPLLSLTDNVREGIVVGLAISLSSTAVVLQCISIPGHDANGTSANAQSACAATAHESIVPIPHAHSPVLMGNNSSAKSLANVYGQNYPMSARGNELSAESSHSFEQVSAGGPGNVELTLDSPKARKVMLALLIFQDVAIGLIVAVLPALKGTMSSFVEDVVGSALRLCVFMILSLLVAEFVLPWILERIDRTRSESLFTISSVLFCLLVAYVSEELGLAIELGAFSAGIMVSESRFRDRVEHSVRSVQDVFAGVFFVAIGMMIHWRYFYLNFFRVVLMLMFILASKCFAMSTVIYLFGSLPTRAAVGAGLALSQAGEFTFVIASKAQALQMFSGPDLRVLNGATALSMLLTPFLVRYARSVARTRAHSGSE